MSAHTTQIHFVRHTEVHNPNDILYGRLPRFRLSDLGRRQAIVTAEVLSTTPVAVIYTSPQLRARQTASAIASRQDGAAIRRSHLLAEVLTGWQGRRHAELEEINFDFYSNPVTDADEMIEDLWRRITRFVTTVRRRHSGHAIVAVTHGDLCAIARACFRGLPVNISSIRRPHPYPGHGSITRLSFGSDHGATYPMSVEYYDPNGQDPVWSSGWVRLESVAVEPAVPI